MYIFLKLKKETEFLFSENRTKMKVMPNDTLVSANFTIILVKKKKLQTTLSLVWLTSLCWKIYSHDSTLNYRLRYLSG